MKRALIVLFVLGGLMTSKSFAQDNMGIGTSSPEPSAVLDLDATDKGFLVPRLNAAQRTSIVTPATGLMVYDTDDNKFWYFDGTIWAQSVGPQGADGADGTNGIDGQDGADGADGADGTNGIDGQDGADGADGADGTNGIDGQDGADGTNGIDGTNGVDGQDGADGADGADGTNGIDGQDGADGADGIDGTNGIDGQDGADGLPGATGPVGPIGPAGPINQAAATAQGSSNWSTSSNGAWVNTSTSVTLTTHGNDVFVSATLSPIVYADMIGFRIMRGTTFICGGFSEAYELVEESGRWTFTYSGMDTTAPSGNNTYTVQMLITDGGTNSYIVESYISGLEINE